jgi:hypothetical protein
MNDDGIRDIYLPEGIGSNCAAAGISREPDG